MYDVPSELPRSYTDDDVLVLQPRRRRRLTAEALDELLVLGEAVVQELQRDLAPELHVVRAVDVRHPAGAEVLDHLVAPVDDGVGLEARHFKQLLHDDLRDRRGDRAALTLRALHVLERHRDRDPRRRAPARSR